MVELHTKAYPMVGGEGEYSYSKNSGPQKAGVEHSKNVLIATISENLDLQNEITPTSYRIADLGCSTGPATFYAVENIIEAVKTKYESKCQSDKIPEFSVFFNDHLGNDFNTLFHSLPSERQYFAAAVPGSFYGRLFPRASLHFAYSSYAIQWLSKLPKDVSLAKSPAYNRGRILYTGAPVEVCDAFSAQFAKDFECFVRTRAEEIVSGGLVALLIPGRSDGIDASQSYVGSFSILESCLLDMSKEGIVSEEAIDSFNVPMYFPSPEELKKVVQKNECFDVVKCETFQPMSRPILSKQHIGAGFGVILTEYFGTETLNELLDRYGKKTAGLAPCTAKVGNLISILIVLKRKN